MSYRLSSRRFKQLLYHLLLLSWRNLNLRLCSIQIWYTKLAYWLLQFSFLFYSLLFSIQNLNKLTKNLLKKGKFYLNLGNFEKLIRLLLLGSLLGDVKVDCIMGFVVFLLFSEVQEVRRLLAEKLFLGMKENFDMSVFTSPSGDWYKGEAFDYIWSCIWGERAFLWDCIWESLSWSSSFLLFPVSM